MSDTITRTIHLNTEGVYLKSKDVHLTTLTVAYKDTVDELEKRIALLEKKHKRDLRLAKRRRR